MHYEDKATGFSFDLPADWWRDENNRSLIFYGPHGGFGKSLELIQIKIGTILPQYADPASREKYLAEPGAQIFRGKIGDETNVVILKKSTHSEISMVRNGLHYNIVYANDEATQAAIRQFQSSARFPSTSSAFSVIQTATRARNDAINRALSEGASIYQVKCADCGRVMTVLGETGPGFVRVEQTEAPAERCGACGRVWCDSCFMRRPKNSCPCNQQRDKIEKVGAITYTGPIRLIKVVYG